MRQVRTAALLIPLMVILLPGTARGAVIFQDDFSVDRGWTGLSDTGWQRGPARAGCGDPGEDHTPSGDEMLLGSLIGACAPTSGCVVTSPVIDCREFVDCRLEYWRWLDVPWYENEGSRGRILLEGFDGEGWVDLWAWPAGGSFWSWAYQEHHDEAWTPWMIPIGAIADVNPAFRLRLTAGDGVPHGEGGGFSLDDLRVMGEPRADAAWRFDRPGVGESPDLVLDGRGYPHVVSTDPETELVTYMSWDGRAWRREVVAEVEYPQYGGALAALVIDGDSVPHVGYARGGLRHAWRDETGWQDELVMEGSSPDSIAADLDAEGRIWFVFTKWGNGGEELHRATLGPAGWETELIYDMYDGSGTIFGFAFDGEGQPHIAMPTSWDMIPSRSEHIVLHKGEWLVENLKQYGEPITLTVDPDGQVVIGCGQSILYPDGDSWRVEDFAAGWAGDVRRITVDTSGALHALGRFPQTRGYITRVTYAVKRGATWSWELIHPANVSLLYGNAPDLAVDPSGRPHVAAGHLYAASRPDLAYDLIMPDRDLAAGDRLLLGRTCRNEAPFAIRLDELLLLEAHGSFWFWPDWSQDPGGTTWRLLGEATGTRTFLDFPWPEGTGVGEGLRFWGAVLEEGTDDLLAGGVVEWGYR